jgi:RNA polymerase sigma-70 factor (ECF subfamily)
VNLGEEPDGRLIERYVRGENAAFEAIVQRYERRVYTIALRMCGEPEDARDVTQDVFVSAMRALRRFRGEAQLATWFHRVATNASLDAMRRRRRHATRRLEDAGDRASDAPGPEESAAASERAAEVQRALGEISDDHRAVLVLHELQGLDYAGVAAALDIPVGTVKSRIHRARLEMAALLGHLRPTAEPVAPADPLKDGR